MVLVSALFYVIPFWHPTLWPVIFLFPALLTIAHVQTISLPSALVWSLIMSVGHLLPIAQALYAMCYGPALFKLIPGVILIAYLTICTAFWLMIASHLKNSLAWIAALWLFILFIDRAVLFPLSGSLEGTIFINPLLVLPPSILTLLPYIGMAGLLGIFCITSSILGLWFCQKTTSSLLILSLVPWIISIGLTNQHKTNFPYHTIGYLPIMVPKTSDSSAVLSSILPYIQESYPHITTMIIPESSCHQLPNINCPINLIMGSFENHLTTRFNIACWIHEENHDTFKKAHTMIFGEILPDWLNNNFFKELIFSTTLPIAKADNTRPQWKLSDTIILVPYICSELFLSNSPQEHFLDPIVAISNDWWFDLPHFKQLMARAARLRAIQWHRPIIYVSYSCGLFFDQFGNTYPLERV